MIEPGRVEQFFATHAFATSYVDLRKVTGNVMRGFRSEALYRVGLGGGVIAIALILLLRSLRRGFDILLPILAILLVTLAILVLAGEALNLFHLLSLLLVAGICMDFGLFFARPVPDDRSSARTFWSVAICALTTMLVFGILAVAGIPVSRAMGMTTFIGVTVGFLVMFLSVRAEVN